MKVLTSLHLWRSIAPKMVQCKINKNMEISSGFVLQNRSGAGTGCKIDNSRDDASQDNPPHLIPVEERKAE
jgi:hypothetical protein